MRKTEFFVGKLRGHLWSKLIGQAPTQPLQHIKHLELDMRLELFPHEYLMKYITDSLFWMSRPETLTLLIPYGFEALAHVMFSSICIYFLFLFSFFLKK